MAAANKRNDLEQTCSVCSVKIPLKGDSVRPQAVQGGRRTEGRAWTRAESTLYLLLAVLVTLATAALLRSLCSGQMQQPRFLQLVSSEQELSSLPLAMAQSSGSARKLLDDRTTRVLARKAARAARAFASKDSNKLFNQYFTSRALAEEGPTIGGNRYLRVNTHTVL